MQLACIHYEPLFRGKGKWNVGGRVKVLKDGWTENLVVGNTLNRIAVPRGT